MKQISLTKGQFTIVDNEDFERLNQYKWFCSNRGYVCRNKKLGYGKFNRKTEWMHRLIINTPENMYTDHINGNKLDNRKSNLRICIKSENNRNVNKRKNNTSGYKGVFFNKVWKTWFVKLTIGKKYITGGKTYKNPKEAAIRYNKLAKKYYGEFASLNTI